MFVPRRARGLTPAARARRPTGRSRTASRGAAPRSSGLDDTRRAPLEIPRRSAPPENGGQVPKVRGAVTARSRTVSPKKPGQVPKKPGQVPKGVERCPGFRGTCPTFASGVPWFEDPRRERWGCTGGRKNGDRYQKKVTGTARKRAVSRFLRYLSPLSRERCPGFCGTCPRFLSARGARGRCPPPRARA